MSKTYIGKIVFIVVISSSLFGGMASVFDDAQYYQKEGDGIRYIYPQEYEETINDTADKSAAIVKSYAFLYGYEFKDTWNLVLASSQNQISNGFSTFSPFNMAYYYDAGSMIIDYMAGVNWYEGLALHEISHSYQLNAQSQEGREMSKYTFQYPFGVLFLSFVFTYPNYYMPLFLLEGDAVLNESVYGNGGRLYHPHTVALTHILAKEDLLTYSRILNNHYYFPYGSEKYLVGGEFFYYLSQKFGYEKTNKFFIHHPTRENKLDINGSIQSYFGANLETLFSEFVATQKEEAKEFTILEGEVLSHAIAKVSLNKVDGEIFYTTTNPYSIPTLNIYKDGELQTQDADLDNGKLFKIEGDYYGVWMNYSDYNHRQIMVRNSDREPIDELSKKVIQDIYQNHTLYLQPSAFNGFKLYVDERYIDDIHSNAIYDKSGAIYYFKQDGAKRTLYKDGVEVVSFEGYYSKLVEVSGESIYFVASTPLGGGLFAYKDGTTYRVSNADNIEDFRQIDEGYGLFSVLKSDGYEVLKAKLDFHEESPYFKQLLSFELPKFTSNLPQEAKEYNSWAEIRPTAFNLFTLGIENMLIFQMADPMMNHSISLIDMLLIGSNGVANVAAASYMNYENRFVYGVGLSASNETATISLAGAYYLDIDDSKSHLLGANYYNENLADNYSELYYEYSNSRTYGISPKSNKKAFTLYGGDRNNEIFALGFSAQYANALGGGWYYGAEFDIGVATGSYFDVSYDVTDSKMGHIDTYVGSDVSYSGDKIANLNIEISKSFDLPFYFTNPYVSAIRREVFTLYAQPTYITGTKIFEYGLKTETELVVDYNFPLSIELTFYKNSTQNDIGVGFGMGSVF